MHDFLHMRSYSARVYIYNKTVQRFYNQFIPKSREMKCTTISGNYPVNRLAQQFPTGGSRNPEGPK